MGQKLHDNIEGFHWASHNMIIKTHGSESRGQEEAACMRVFWPTRPLQWVIYTDGSSKILKRSNSATIAVSLT